MKSMKQIYVGIFPLGHENVDLYALPGESGGFFFTKPDDSSRPRIKVGLDHRYWDEVVSVLIHETTEMAMARMSVRYQPSGDLANDHSSYLFMFNHPQFSEICARVAMFITPALPELSKVFEKEWKKKKR